MRNERTRVIVEIGLTVALAAALNYVRIWRMPQGGSVALDMLPIFVLAFRRGPVPGLLAGVLFGFVDYFLDPFPPVHPFQFALDYPIAFGAVGLAGVFSKPWRDSLAAKKTAAATAWLLGGFVLGSALRYVAHVVSGVVYFAEYAEGQPVLAYSTAYNSFVWVSAVACFAAAAVVLPALERVVPTRTAG